MVGLEVVRASGLDVGSAGFSSAIVKGCCCCGYKVRRGQRVLAPTIREVVGETTRARHENINHVAQGPE